MLSTFARDPVDNELDKNNSIATEFWRFPLTKSSFNLANHIKNEIINILSFLRLWSNIHSNTLHWLQIWQASVVYVGDVFNGSPHLFQCQKNTDCISILSNYKNCIIIKLYYVWVWKMRAYCCYPAILSHIRLIRCVIRSPIFPVYGRRHWILSPRRRAQGLTCKPWGNRFKMVGI